MYIMCIVSISLKFGQCGPPVIFPASPAFINHFTDMIVLVDFEYRDLKRCKHRNDD